jgi:hypothetical protein
MRLFAFGIFGTLAFCLGLNESAAQSERLKGVFPKIDQSVPEKIETATLALG